jgi:hypothetical protein
LFTQDAFHVVTFGILYQELFLLEVALTPTQLLRGNNLENAFSNSLFTLPLSGSSVHRTTTSSLSTVMRTWGVGLYKNLHQRALFVW